MAPNVPSAPQRAPFAPHTFRFQATNSSFVTRVPCALLAALRASSSASAFLRAASGSSLAPDPALAVGQSTDRAEGEGRGSKQKRASVEGLQGDRAS